MELRDTTDATPRAAPAAVTADALSPRLSIGILAIAGLFFPIYWIVYGVGILDAHFIDAKSFWLGARLALVEGVSPYPWETFSAASDQLPGGYAHPFVYPPPSLVLLWPLAGLSYGQATTALVAASHAGILLIALGCGCVLSADRLRQNRATLAIVAGLAVFIAVTQATRVTLGHGQVNVVVVCGLVWFWAACLGRASAVIGAAGLIAAALLKPYFGIFAIFLVLSGGRRLLTRVIALSLALLIVTALAVPLDAWGDWVRLYLFELSSADLYLGRFEIYSPNNFALRAVVDALFGVESRAVWPWLVSAMVAAQLGALVRTRAAPAEARTIQVASLMMLIFLAAPVSWIHYLLYVVVAAGLVFVISMRGGHTALAVLSGLTSAALLQPTAFGTVHPWAVYTPVLLTTLLWTSCIARAFIPNMAAPAWR